MSITSTVGDGVRITSPAVEDGTTSQGTLGSQGGIDPDEVVVPAAISNNEGNLESTPSYVGRLFVLRYGESDEETRFITAIATLTLTVHEDWVVAPVSGDTWMVSYIVQDAATVNGLTLINKRTADYAVSRDPFSVGTDAGSADPPGFFFLAAGASLEGNDSNAPIAFEVEADGRWDNGFLAGGVPVSGGYLIGTNDADAEIVFQTRDGSILRFYDFFLTNVNNVTWVEDIGSLLSDHEFDSFKMFSGANASAFGQPGLRANWRIEGLASTGETIELTGVSQFEDGVIVSTDGFTSRDDGVTELLLVQRCVFSRNLRQVEVHDDKVWFFVNVDGWSDDEADIDFQVDDLNIVIRTITADIFTSDSSGGSLSGVTVWVEEHFSTGAILAHDETVFGGKGFFPIRARYSFPSDVFTVEAFTFYAIKAYSYGKFPSIQGFDITVNSQVFPVTLVDDVAITEPDGVVATENGVGIEVTRHGAGDTDPRPINVIGYSGGTDGGDGGPSVGDVITGAGGATGEVIEILGAPFAAGFLVLETRNATAFVDAETLTDTTQTNEWTATADLTPAPGGVDLDYTWEVDCNSEAMTTVYDYLAAKMAQRRFPLTLEDDGGAFTDFTESVDEQLDTGSFRLFPSTPAVGDAIYLGDREGVPEEFTLDLSSGTTGLTLAFEYWNGSWTALSGLSDGTTGLTVDGVITYDHPTDWAKTSVNGSSAYWIRIRVTGVTAPAGGTGVNWFTDQIFQRVALWGQEEVSQLVFFGPDGFLTSRNVSLTDGVIITNRGGGEIDFFTDDGGTEFTPPVNRTYTITGLESSSEVRIFDDPSLDINLPGVEVDGVENSGTSFAHAYQFSADQDVIVHIFHLDFKPIRFQDVLGNADKSVQVFQIPDPNFL